MNTYLVLYKNEYEQFYCLPIKALNYSDCEKIATETLLIKQIIQISIIS
jgi:hypothetical protein